MKLTKAYIHFVISRTDGRRSEAKIEGTKITNAMFDSAEYLLHTCMTGERPVIKNLYDLVARAFNTTREDTKTRITAAAFGMSSLKYLDKNIKDSPP